MNRHSLLAVSAAAFLISTGPFLISAAHEAEQGKKAFAPGTIPWGAPPPIVRPGAQFAVLEGDPTASTGDFTIRLKMPDGYRIDPHWHPKRENVTVISGTFRVGMGDTFDAKAMKTFPAGSFAYLDPDMHHFAMAQGETIVQVHGQSPLQFNYINPADDPSKTK